VIYYDLPWFAQINETHKVNINTGKKLGCARHLPARWLRNSRRCQVQSLRTCGPLKKGQWEIHYKLEVWINLNFFLTRKLGYAGWLFFIFPMGNPLGLATLGSFQNFDCLGIPLANPREGVREPLHFVEYVQNDEDLAIGVDCEHFTHLVIYMFLDRERVIIRPLVSSIVGSSSTKRSWLVIVQQVFTVFDNVRMIFSNLYWVICWRPYLQQPGTISSEIGSSLPKYAKLWPVN
jgi:hypothetical protein